MHEEDEADTPHRARRSTRWKYQRYMQDYLACVQSVDDNVGRLLDFLDGSGLEQTRSSSTRATRASSSATTACTTSGSCTRRACACRSSSAGRRDSRRGSRE